MSRLLLSLLLLNGLCCAPATAQAPLLPLQVSDINTRLQTTLAEITTDTLAFLEEWNATASACNATSDTLFGNMKAPCRAVRAAIRRGTVPAYRRACFLKGSEAASTLLDSPAASALRQNQADALEAVLIPFEQGLFSVCGLESALADYPAFAGLFEESRNGPVGGGFDTFGSMDSMAWWNPQTDPANIGNVQSTSNAPRPAIPNTQ